MNSMTLLVSGIHPGNALLYWLLSFVVRVEALYFHRMCAWLARVRIYSIGRADAFSCRDGWAFRVKAVGDWEVLAEQIPRHDWQATYRGIDLDFTNKAKQDLWRAFEDFQILKAIQQRRRAGSTHLVCSARIAYLAGLAGDANFFGGISITGWMSRVHGLLDRLWEGAIYASKLSQMGLRLGLGLLARVSPSRDTLARSSILYLCDNLNDLHESLEKRSVAWIIDGTHIRHRDVLFVLPAKGDERQEHFLAVLPNTELRAGTIPRLYQQVSARASYRAIVDIVRRMWALPLMPLLSVEGLLVRQFVARAIGMAPIVDQVRPSCCLETDSSLGFEDPALVYFNHIQIATVMCQNTSLLNFFTRPGGIAARDFIFAHVLASRILCWNEQGSHWMRSHPQEGSTMVVLGPLMPGFEDVLSEDRRDVRVRILPPGRSADVAEGKWLSVFDNHPAVCLPGDSRARIYEEPYNEDQWLRFGEDVLQLLIDFPSLTAVYKLKRDYVVGKRFPVRAYFPNRSDEYERLIERLRRHERVIVLAEDVNPWLPFAVADICLAVAGTSPVCAGWHVGIPGIYHDPLGQLGPEDHEGMRPCLTHDYAALRSKVEEFLWPIGPSPVAREWHAEWLLQYVGNPPGVNAHAEFRRFLMSYLPAERLEERHRESPGRQTAMVS